MSAPATTPSAASIVSAPSFAPERAPFCAVPPVGEPEPLVEEVRLGLEEVEPGELYRGKKVSTLTERIVVRGELNRTVSVEHEHQMRKTAS